MEEEDRVDWVDRGNPEGSQKRIPTVMIPTIERTVATVVAALLKERNKKRRREKSQQLGQPVCHFWE